MRGLPPLCKLQPVYTVQTILKEECLRRKTRPASQGASCPPFPGRLQILALLLVLLSFSGCSRSNPAAPSTDTDKGLLRLGYFLNLTHAAAIVGVENGLLEKQLTPTGGVSVKTFNAGPAAVEALFSEGLDAAYIGSGPAINAYVRSKGKDIRIISGATEGGAFLVVDPAINGPADLKGKKIATPQLGNTQDIALRTWLKSKGLATNLQGGGEVSIVPQENAQTLDTFKSGQIAGAWLPEPWASRLAIEAGAKVLVDEADLWPERRFPTTVLIVRTDFLRANPDAVKALVSAHLQATEFLTINSEQAQRVVNQGLAKATGTPIGDKVLA
ncbi:MAG: ABC transporter substrate-binding protein, partial [Acidimicrobiia bacterium]